jgi:hypothetical protein
MKCSVPFAILLEITANLYVHRLEIRHSKRGQANRQQGIPQAARQSARRKKTERAPSRLWGAVDAVGERHGTRPFNIRLRLNNANWDEIR